MKRCLNYLLLAVVLMMVYNVPSNAQRSIIYPDSVDNNFFRARDARLKYWDTVGVDKRKGEYKQFNRWRHFWETRVLPNGDFPSPELYYNAWKQMKEETNNLKRTNKLLSMPEWKEIGPLADPPGSGVNAGVGRINVIKGNPNNLNEIWAGSASGGVWKSTNGGKKWTPLAQTEFLSLGVSDIAIAPSNPSVVYVATGDNDGAISSFKFYSIGIIKTTDGGKTWDLTGKKFSTSNSNLVTKIWVHPDNENIVIAASNKGIMKSTDGGETWEYKTAEMHLSDLKQKPKDPNTLYASSMSMNVSSGVTMKNFIFKSTDCGETWTQIKEIEGARRTCMGVSDAMPDVLYVLSSNNDGGFLSLISSDDAGETWYNTNLFSKNKKNYLDWGDAGRTTKGQGYYDLALAVDPKDPNKLFIGGVNIWYSTDAGLTFKLVAHWYAGYEAPYVHADIHDLRYVGNRLYAGHDGGIDYTENSGTGWTAVNDGLAITQFYKFDNSKQNPYLILAGAQDNGTRGYGFTANQWSYVNGGDGMDCAIDPSDDKTYYFSVYNGSFYRTTPQKSKVSIFSPTIVYNKFKEIDTGSWVTPIAIDQKYPENIYIGYTNLYKSKDKGTNWEKLTNIKYSPSNLFDIVRAYDNYVYAATSSKLTISSDGGATLKNITVPGSGSIVDICINQENPEIVYIVRTGYAEKNRVLRYDGNEWLDLTGNLPKMPINCIFHQSNNNDRIYVGTDIGVYTCTKNVPFYTRWGTGLPMLCITDLDIIESIGKLRAATYGRGIWEVDLDRCVPSNVDIKCEGITTFCQGDSVKLYIEGDYQDIVWSNGETSNYIWAKENGKYWVATNVNSDCPSISEKCIDITIYPTKELNITVSKTLEFCEGDSVVLSIPIGFTENTYKWSTGETSRKIIVKEPGVYWGSAESGNNSCRSYDTVVVKTYPVPEQPVISVLEGIKEVVDGDTVKHPDTLIVYPEAEKYQWYRNKKELTNQVSQRLVLRVSGDYTVEISTGGDCWRGSEVVTGIEEVPESIIAEISPNPAKSYISLKLNKNDNNNYLIDIIDITGKNIARFNDVILGTEAFNIDVSNYSAGTYFVKIISKNNVITKQFIKE